MLQNLVARVARKFSFSTSPCAHFENLPSQIDIDHKKFCSNYPIAQPKQAGSSWTDRILKILKGTPWTSNQIDQLRGSLKKGHGACRPAPDP